MMTPEQMIEIFNNLPNAFDIASMWSVVFRAIGWWIINFLTSISGFFEKSMEKIYSLNNFFNSETVNNIVTLFKPLIFCTLMASIVYIGYKLIIDREFKGEKIFQNIILSSAIILILPALMLQLNDATNQAIEILKNDYKGTNSQKIVLDNLSDLKYLESVDFKSPEQEGVEKKLNNLQVNQLSKLDINQTVERNLGTKEIFKKKLDIDENSKEKIVDLDNGFLGMGKEEYYRFNFNFVWVVIPLLCTILTYILTSLKVVRLVFELGIVKILAIFYAFGDIANGRKIREILQHLLSTFVIIFATALILNLYSGFIAWIDSQKLNIYVRLMFIIGSSWAVIDGPNIVERIFGIDAGVKSGWGVFMAIKDGSKGLNNMAKGAIGAGKAVGNMAQKIGGSELAQSISEKALAGATAGAKTGSQGLASVAGGLAGMASGKPLEEQAQDMNVGSSGTGSSKDDIDKSSDNIPKSDSKPLNEQSNTSEDINTNNSNQGDIGSSYGDNSSLSQDNNQDSNSNLDSDTTSSNDIDSSMNDNASSNSQVESLESQSSNNESDSSSTLNDDISTNSNDNISQSINDSSNSSSQSESLENQSSNLNSDEDKSSGLKPSIEDKSDTTPNLEDKGSNHYGDVFKNKFKEGKEAVSKGKDSLGNNVDKAKNAWKDAPENISNKKKDFLNNTNTGSAFKRHYNLGANTTIALRNKLNNKKGKK